jgi:RHS repeat-associated protein
VVNQYTAVTGAGTLAYSSRGDLTHQGDWSYVHDAGGNLIRAHNTQSNLLAKYWRDAAGHRAVKEVDGQKTLFFNFGFWPLEAYDTTAETARSTIHEPGIDRPLAEINNDGTIRFFYHQDWLGNVAMLTDAGGAKLQTYTYDVWGEPSGFDASGNPIAASAFESRFLFTAREFDPETGLYHYRARAYSPAMGRFLQTDPIDFAGGDANLMRYASNSPVNLVDPFGLVEMSYTPNSHQGLRDWEETYDNPEAFDVTGHGNKDAMYDCEGREMAPDEVADDIVNHPSFRPGMPVNLISCNTGQGGKGSFADKLAKAIKNKTGVPSKVTAPEKKIGPKLDRNKNPIPGSKPQQPGLDKWRRFK